MLHPAYSTLYQVMRKPTIAYYILYGISQLAYPVEGYQVMRKLRLFKWLIYGGLVGEMTVPGAVWE